MTRRTVLHLVHAVLAAFLALLMAGALPVQAAPRAVKIVVLGDSYASGNGAGLYYGPEGCYRSHAGWVERYASGLRAAGYAVELVNRACSGARTEDVQSERIMATATYSIPLLGDQRSNEAAARRTLAATGLCAARHPEERYDVTVTGTQFNGLITTFTFTCTRVLAPQIDALGPDADLVLMTIGGNDVGFSTLVRECFVIPTAAGCRAAVDRANSLLGPVQQSITDVLAAVGARLKPEAKVALVSYPYLERSDDLTVTSLAPPDSYRAGLEVRKLGARGDDVQSAAVAAANQRLGRNFALLVDGVKERFAGHEPDGNPVLINLQGWIHEVTSPIPAEWYHPNSAGHGAYAALMLEHENLGIGRL